MKQPVQELMALYQNNLFIIAFNVCKNVEDAEDVVQDTFLQYHTSKKDFESDSDFSAISGSIQLYLPADANPELNCSSTSGHVYSEYHDSKTKKLKDKIGSGLYELKAKSVSGSVKINKLNK